MSGSHKVIPKAESEQMRRQKFASFSKSLKENIKIIRDNLRPILRIQAIEGAEVAIGCACASEVLANKGDQWSIEKSKVLPDIGDYFKALVNFAKEPMSEENLSTVLKHIANALSGELIADLGEVVIDTYDIAPAPFFAEICATTIKILIEFRNKSDMVRRCEMILEYIFLEYNFLKERKKCGDIAVASGLIPTLTNMITRYSMYGALGDKASSEKLCESALGILNNLLAFNWSQLSDSVLVETAHPVFHCVLNSKSESILYNGINVISGFLSTTGKKTIDLEFTNGKTGVQNVLLVIEHALNVMKTGHGKNLTFEISEMIKQLAKLILHREDLTALIEIMLNMDETLSTKILLTFAELMNTECEKVLVCLSEPAASTSGRNYIREVIEGGFCQRYESFQPRDRTTVNIALLNIYDYGVGVKTSDSKLHEEVFEAVRARLLSLDVGDVGGKI